MSIAPQAKSEWKDAHVHPPGFRARRGLNWFTVGLLYATFYMCRYNFRFAGPGMRAEFGWDAQQIADLAGWFSLAYGTGQLINGLFSDRIGGRATMLIGAIGTIVLNLIIGFTPSISTFSVFAMLWMVNGYLQAAGAPGMVEVDVGQQHPVHRLGGDAERGERAEDARHRGIARGIDDGGAPVLHDHVDGGELRAAVAGVDRMHAVAVVDQVLHCSSPMAGSLPGLSM